MEIATPSGASPFPKLTFDHKLLITKHLISNNDENRKTPDHLVGEMSSTSGIFENGAKSRLNHNETGGAVDNNSNNNNNISAATTREGQQSETESMSETQLNKSPLIQENKLVDFCNNNNGSLDGHNGNYERMKSIASGVSVGDGDGIVHDTVKPCNNNHQPNHHHSSNATINDNNNITLSNKNSDTNSVKNLVTSASAITTNTCATTTSLQETKFKKPELTMLNSINSNHHIPLQSPSIPYRKQSVFVAPAGLNLIIHENRNNHSVNHYKQQHQQLYNQQQHQLHTQTQHNQHHDHAGTATVSSFSSSLTSTSSSLSSYPSIAKGETSNGISLASSNSSITRKNSTGLQPKVNAQEIGQHINKLISENAAIVETTDSLYVKKYLSRHSVSSVPSGSHFAANNTTTTSSTASTSNGATPSMRRYSEIFVDPNHSTGSKLQSALLGRIVTTCPLTTDNTVVTPTNVPHAHISALTATNHQTPTKKFSEPIYPSVIMNMKQSRHQEQQQQSNLPTKKDSTSSLPIGGGSVLAQGSLVDPIVGPSLVRNLLTSSKNASTIKVIPVPVASHVSNAGGTPIIGIPSSVGPTDGSAKINPENPEGSIIKDLLLKARDSGEPSERKISRTNLTIPPIQEELSMLVYVCTLCKIAFRNKETLEAHQTHYCKADETQSTNDMSLNQLQLLNDHVQRKISVMESSFLQQQLTKPLPSTSNSKTSGSLFSQLQPKQQQQSQQQQQPIVGNILKQQLLAPSQGPPLKKRKTSEPVFPKSHLHHQQHHHIATAITNDISPLFRKTSVVQSSITKLIGPKLLPQESVPIEVDGIPSSLVSSVIVNSNSNSSCSNSTSLNSFSSTHVVSVINEPVTFPSTTVSLIQPTFSLPAWSSLSSSSSSSLASHSLSISSSSTTGANQSSLDKLSSPANGTKIEILPDYYPHLKYPKTKVTLTGPIVFPVLQKLLTEKKDNLEFHAQEISLGSSSTLSTSNNVGDAVGGTDVTINKTYLVYKQVPSIPEFEEEEKVEDDDEDKRNEVNASIQDDSDDDGNGSNSKMNGKIISETQTSNNQTAETVTADVVVKKEESSSLTLSSKSEDVDEEMKTINNEDEDRKNTINEKELNRTYEENKSNNSEIPISSSSSSSLVPVSNGRVTVSNGSCRPTSLTLRKKNPINAFKLIGSTLVSPDTPRPKRKCMQLYINGQAYTHLGLKMSTRSTYCCIYRPQPMYVPQEAQSKLSMYSNWQIIAPHDDIFNQITPSELFHAYDTRQRKSFKVQGIKFTFAPSSESNKPLTDGFILTPSSYWIVKKQSEEKVLLKREILELKRKGVEELTEMMDNCVARKTSEDRLSNMSGFDSDSNDPNQPKRVKIFEGGFKSNEDYTYVRGRGRGKYVCEECGIRCKKPSMLKKHIRTHTDLRPYSCRHCAFAFKTKGNLTKHMKSKAHHKKCVELGIIPVPITIDDSQIDCDALAKQEAIERSYSGGNLASDDDDNDDEDGCEDDDDEGSDDEGVPIPIMTSSEIIASHKKMDLDVNNEPKEQRKSIIVANEIDEQEVARSLLVLSGSGEWSAPGGAVAGPTPSIRSSSTELKENRINTSLSYVSNKIDPTKPVDKLSEETKHVGASSGSANANNNSHFFNLSKWTPNIGNYSRQRSFSFNDGLIRNNPSYAHNLETLRVGKRDRPEKPEKPVEVNVQSPIIEPISTDDSNDSEVEDHFVRRYSMSVIQDKPSPFPWHQSRTGGAHSEEGPIDLSKRGDDMDLSIAEHGGVCVTGSSHPSGRRNTLSTPTASHPFVYKELAGYSGAMNAASFTEDGKSVCRICNKSFSKLSQLRLHVNIHFLERPFRCDSCGVSFRTKGHLQKHERSVTHFNKVNINMTFGTPTTDNPRPFKCDDCIIAFRIHGHLAKHLRSKAHIMKLECAGKLPCGMYADMERFGISLNEIDTNDCENSLQSLQSMAEKMYSKGGEVDVSWLKQSTNNNNEPNLTEETDKPRLLPASSGSFSSYHETQAPPASPPIQRSFSFSETNSRYGPITKRLSTPDGSQYRPQLFSSKNFHSFGPSSSATSQFKSTDMSTQSVSGSTSNMHLYTGSPLAPMTSGTNSHHPLTLSDHHPHHHHHHHSDYNFSSVISSAASSTSSRSSSSPSHYVSPSSLTDHVQQQTVPTNIIGNPISNHNLPLPTLTSSNSLGDISCIIPGKPAMSSGSSNSQKTVIYSQQSSLNPTNHPSSFNSQLQPPLQAPPIPLSTTANQFIANDQTSTSAPLISVPLTTPATSVSTTTSSTTNITSIRSNTCHYCNQVFKSAKFLQVHLYCDHQQQRSSSPSLVNEKQHQPEITDKDHKNICDICRKSFPDALLLQKHLLSHSTPRPYVCDICDAGFTSASALASHLPTHSVPQTQGLVICHECGQKFMNQIDFHRHLQLHVNDTNTNVRDT